MTHEYPFELDSLCNTVLDVNENIQSVSVINKNGRAVGKAARGVDTLVHKEKNEMFLMQCALTISMGRDFDEHFGEIGYVYVERKNMALFSFPFGEHIVLVTSKTTIGSISLAREIITAIKKYKNTDNLRLSQT